MQRYEYAYFPGMCGCVGLIIQDTKQPDKFAIVHYLSFTNPESVLALIHKVFLSKDITITTFAGNPPEGYTVPEEFPKVAIDAANIKNSVVPKYDEALADLFGDRNYYLNALQNRYEVNYILKSLKNLKWNLIHIHNNTVSFSDNVFLNLQDKTLSTNLQVNVWRDDFTREELENPFTNTNRAIRDDLWSRLCEPYISRGNIIVTDKRSWEQYNKDCVNTLSANKTTLFYYTAGLTIAAAGVASFYKKATDANQLSSIPHNICG